MERKSLRENQIGATHKSAGPCSCCGSTNTYLTTLDKFGNKVPIEQVLSKSRCAALYRQFGIEVTKLH